MINEVKFITQKGENYSLIAKIMELIVSFLIDNCAKGGKFKCVFNIMFYYRAGVLLFKIVDVIKKHRIKPEQHQIAFEKFIHFDNLMA